MTIIKSHVQILDTLENLDSFKMFFFFDFQNGTCYTDAECQTREGTASGSCAEGYGVCCVCKFFFIYLFKI